ncbi:hypothetical protein HII31_08246 [Pseudocercospora fuligena]|uniref:Uncharacterized protein n=1 Tax=Pseudocercospora fuligena TaxID=685502 RepID=A0A8H6RGW8_9PEZI|nr:hypothetical protein HII31_08246 [Pseudocercospora fuligena]
MASPPPPPRQARHLCLLDLHPVILKEIMQYLFPPKTIEFVSAPDGPLGQTSYLTSDSRSPRETYVSTSNWLNAPQLQEIIGDEYERMDFATSFLLVSRECYHLGAPHLYAREFSFPSCVETSLAFLHDHGRASPHRATQLHLKYGVNTTQQGWRLLFNVLVHERHVKRVKVTVSEDFWHFTPWHYGPHAVWDYELKSEARSSRRSKPRCWIDHLARLPMKAKFGEDLGEKWRGVDFSLEIIDYSNSFDRKAFSVALESAVYNRSNADRRSQAPMVQKLGYCEETWLEFSCHWDMKICRCRGDFWSPYYQKWIKGSDDWLAACD